MVAVWPRRRFGHLAQWNTEAEGSNLETIAVIYDKMVCIEKWHKITDMNWTNLIILDGSVVMEFLAFSSSSASAISGGMMKMRSVLGVQGAEKCLEAREMQHTTRWEPIPKNLVYHNCHTLKFFQAKCFGDNATDPMFSPCPECDSFFKSDLDLKRNWTQVI